MKILQYKSKFIKYFIAIFFHFMFFNAFLLTVTNAIAKEIKTEIRIKVDHAQLVQLSKPGANVILGNPTIADITMQTRDLMVVTGKSYGMTNVIVLDDKKEIILRAHLTVIGHDKNIVSVYSGSARKSFACTPKCQATVAAGDDPTHFDSILKANAEKNNAATQTTTTIQAAQ